LSLLERLLASRIISLVAHGVKKWLDITALDEHAMNII